MGVVVMKIDSSKIVVTLIYGEIIETIQNGVTRPNFHLGLFHLQASSKLLNLHFSTYSEFPNSHCGYLTAKKRIFFLVLRGQNAICINI